MHTLLKRCTDSWKLLAHKPVRHGIYIQEQKCILSVGCWCSCCLEKLFEMENENARADGQVADEELRLLEAMAAVSRNMQQVCV